MYIRRYVAYVVNADREGQNLARPQYGHLLKEYDRISAKILSFAEYARSGTNACSFVPYISCCIVRTVQRTKIGRLLGAALGVWGFSFQIPSGAKAPRCWDAVRTG